ncbi:MAG: hypothetical protein V1676_01830 [Candidatus Diapherotrites archaeon]
MMLEVLQAFISLDIAYFLHMIEANLFWIFGLAAGAYYLSNGKGIWRDFALISIIIFGSLAIQEYFDVSIYIAEVLLFMYISRVVALLLLENTPGWSKYIPHAWVFTWWATWIGYNLFMK